MKTHKTDKKMSIKKKTIANLEIQEIKTAKGGIRRPPTRELCWTIFTCPITNCAPGCFD